MEAKVSDWKEADVTEETKATLRSALTLDEDGYYCENEDEEAAGVLTKVHPNGSKVKKVTLSDGRVAIVRQLKGRDFINVKKQMKNADDADFETLNMSMSVTIDGEVFPPEYFLDNLYMSDYAKILVPVGALNFQ